jgi:uncharacterized UPF0160 family protein
MMDDCAMMKKARTVISGGLLLSSRMGDLLRPIEEGLVISKLSDAPENAVVIGTHDGTFHCDEALAISMLKMLPQYSQATILRTRKPDMLDACNIVVDVGAKYDPASNRYDHHQREFTGTLDDYTTKLSSAGLVYKHFGKDVLRQVLKKSDDDVVSEELVDICYTKLYTGFMEHIDAIDNGISVSDGDPKYHVSTTLSSRVGNLNLQWNDEDQSAEATNERFVRAMYLTCSEFLEKADYLSNAWWPARSIVRQSLDKRFDVHPSGRVIVLEQYCPWKEHLFDLEKEIGCEPILYALYGDTGGAYRIQAVPVNPQSFQSRKKLPAEWCGLRDDVLSDKTGIPGGIFIHAGGFIGGHSTKEGALAMTAQALEME